jgi:hypothetical protein
MIIKSKDNSKSKMTEKWMKSIKEILRKNHSSHGERNSLSQHRLTYKEGYENTVRRDTQTDIMNIHEQYKGIIDILK